MNKKLIARELVNVAKLLSANDETKETKFSLGTKVKIFSYHDKLIGDSKITGVSKRYVKLENGERYGINDGLQIIPSADRGNAYWLDQKRIVTAKSITAKNMEPNTVKDWKLSKESKDGENDAAKITKALEQCKDQIDKAVRTAVKNTFLPAIKKAESVEDMEGTRDVGLLALSAYIKWTSDNFLHDFIK